MKLGTATRRAALAAATAAAIATALLPVVSHADTGGGNRHAVKHVVVISVDGLHESDLEAYVATRPRSTLAKFVNEGASYSNARTPFPSDSFPGLTAIVTGGNPKSTGVYYDDSWNRLLLPAGTTSCGGVAPGVEVTSDPTKIKKISEHGGDARQDRHVPIIVWGGGIGHEWIDDKVETTQIAPTILKLLGLPPHELEAVQLEGTEVLPALERG